MPAMSTDRGRHAVFLDRDGVLNRAVIRGGRPFPPRTTQDLEIPEDAAASLHALRRAGYALVAVTNQPDVSRGTAATGGRRGHSTAKSSADCPSMTFGSVTTTMPTGASAASPSQA